MAFVILELQVYIILERADSHRFLFKLVLIDESDMLNSV